MSPALPLSLVAPSGPPRLRVVLAPPSAPPYDDEPGGPPLLRLVPAPAEPVVLDDSAWFTEERTPTAELPDPRVFVSVLLQGLLEVLAGARSLTQLRRQTTVELYAELSERLQGGQVVRGGRPEPGAVGRVHAQEWPEGIAEACATVRRHGRLSAVAVRVEGFGGRWVCCEVEGL